jgi:hypothetical protein
MSRYAIPLMLILASSPAGAAEPAAQDDSFERYLAFTSVNPDCRAKAPADMIVVCGKRNADRYRVPLVLPVAGDPGHEGVGDERVRLQHQTTPCQDRGPFLIKCGMVGVAATVGFGGGKPQFRELAP